MDQPGGDVFADPGNWGQWTAQLPTGALHTGTNTLTIQNLESVATVNQPPWVMVDRAVVRLAS
jgi:hypothetical protein